MLKLQKCLFFMKLETGGLIIGSMHLVTQVMLFLFCAAYLTIYDCSDFERLLQLDDNRICKFHRDFIAFTLFFLVVSALLAVFSYRNCIKGIREKNFELLGPFTYFLAVVTLLSIYNLFYFTLVEVIMALAKGMIAGYMYLVVNSYYIQLRDGPESKLVTLDSDQE